MTEKACFFFAFAEWQLINVHPFHVIATERNIIREYNVYGFMLQDLKIPFYCIQKTVVSIES